MTDAAPNAPEETVSHNLFCVGCDYSLLGLPRVGVCPECGASVASSLERRLAAELGPRGCRALKAGTGWLESAAAAQVIGFCLPAVIYLALPAWVIGSWAVARHPLASNSDDSHSRAARAVRRAALVLGAAVALGGTATAGAIWVTPIRFFGTPGVRTSILVFAASIQAVAFAYSAATTTQYLAGLAQRLPDAVVARRLRRARVMATVWSAGLAAYLIIVATGMLWIGGHVMLGWLAPVAIAGWIAAFVTLDSLTRWRIALAEGL